jgi:hypothetical protein
VFFGTTTISVVVENDSPNALPADNSVLTLTLPAGLTANGPTTFTLPALAPFGQTSPFTITAEGNPSDTTITATIVSPDANPVLTTGVITVLQPTPQPVNGQLMVFALGFVNQQLVLFYVDPGGRIFYEPFTFTNFFSPDPASAVFFNSSLVVRNMAPTDIFGSPGIVGFILDVNGNTDLATTVPLNFIAAAALQDLITALQQPGA